MIAELLETLFLALILCGVVAYYRLSRFVWVPLFTFLLLGATVYSLVSWWELVCLWALFGVIAAFTVVTPLRYKLVSAPLLNFMKKSLPAIGETERVAIESGDIWWEAELMQGTPRWKNILNEPLPALTSEEQSFLDQQTDILCRMLDDWKIVHEWRDLPPEVWEYIKKERFWAMVIPKAYGGLGFSAAAHSAVVAKIASKSVSAAVTVMVPNSLGPSELLIHYGTEAQKNYYLPRLASGEEIPCFALTSVESGSDAATMPDRGVVCRDKFEGKEVLGIRLNWEKRYITLAPVATVLGLAFKLFDPDHLLGPKEDLGITLCLLPTKHLGVEIGRRHFPLTMAFMNGPTSGKDVFIPMEWVIGGRAMIGQGWRMLMECLSVGRAISLPAMSTASAMLSFKTTGAYARLRRQFKLPIGYFEGVEAALAKIGGYTYLIEACRQFTNSAVQQGIKPAIASAIAKYTMTEMARDVVDSAMDVHAGRGIQMGPRNYLAHAYISMPIGITVEGANILTRNLIIFGQGILRCHPYLRGEVALVTTTDQDPKETLQQFDTLLMKHTGFVMRNALRTLWLGLTGARFVWWGIGAKPFARSMKQLSRMSAALAFMADVSLMVLGGNLKRRERISARLGDVLSYLYLASAVLRYSQKHSDSKEDTTCARWCLQHCLHQIQEALLGVCSNLPKRWLGVLLARFIFPWGRVFSKPADSLDRDLAQEMLSPSRFRDRLTGLCFVGDPKNPQDPVAAIEALFLEIVEVDKVQQRVRKALKSGALPKQSTLEKQLRLAEKSGLITSQELAQLQQLNARLREATMVDDFAPDDSIFV